MPASWWDQVTASPLSKHPNMPLPSIYRLQTRSRAQFCVNKSSRLPPAPNRQKVTILKCAKIPRRTKTSQCDLLKSPSVKTFVVGRWWWRRQVFFSGCAVVALAFGRGQRSYPDAPPDDALHLLWCVELLMHTGMHIARTEMRTWMHTGMHTQMCLVLIGRHSSSFKGHKAAQERSFRIFPDLTIFRTFRSYWLLQFK